MEGYEYLAVGITCGVVATFICLLSAVWMVNKRVPEEKKAEMRVYFYLMIPEIIFLGMIAFGLYWICRHGIPPYW